MAASWQIPVLVFAAVFAVAMADSERKLWPLVGAPEDASVDDRGVQKALHFAIKEYNKASNDKFAFKVSQVLDVKKQVVNGLKYFITVNMARTACTNSYVVVENCELHKEPEMLKTIKCNFEIYTVPWRSKTTMTKRNCEE